MKKSHRTPQISKLTQHVPLCLIFFFLGYLTAYLDGFEGLRHWFTQIHPAEAPKQSLAASTAHKQAPKPKFEFYTLLTDNPKATAVAHAPAQTSPSTSATLPHAPETSSAEAKMNSAALPSNLHPPLSSKPPTAAPSQAEQYFIQVAAFKVKKDAEKIQSTLILKGFDVRVVAINQNQIQWFRVLVGPYANVAFAHKTQAKLYQTEHLNGMIRHGISG